METPRSSWSLRTLRHLRAWGLMPFIRDPERVVMNFMISLIGLSSLLVRKPGSLVATWEWVGPVWSLSMFFGGVFVIIGMWVHKLSLERLGYLMIFPCVLLFAISAFWVYGIMALVVGLIFIGFSVSKAMRLLVTGAEREEIIELGELLDGR